MPFEIILAVFDCNVYIQASLNPNSIAAKCFDVVRKGKVKLFILKDTLAEIRDCRFKTEHSCASAEF